MVLFRLVSGIAFLVSYLADLLRCLVQVIEAFLEVFDRHGEEMGHGDCPVSGITSAES